MGLLRLVNNVPGIDYREYRDIDYWGKFKYRARVTIPVPVARTLYYVKNVTEWKLKVITHNKYLRLSDHEKRFALSQETLVSNFLQFKELIKKNKVGNIRIEGNTVAIFSNDLTLLQNIKTWDTNVNVDFTEVIIGQFAGVKYFVRQPKNNFRVYLRSKRVDHATIDQLRDLLNRQPRLKPSTCFIKWLSTLRGNNFRYLSASFFIDYDDESMLSYLALCHGEILGKKYKLEKRV